MFVFEWRMENIDQLVWKGGYPGGGNMQVVRLYKLPIAGGAG